MTGLILEICWIATVIITVCEPLLYMSIGARCCFDLNGVKEKVLDRQIKRHTKQYQGYAQHGAIPERQAHAHPVEQCRARFLR